MIGTQEMRDRDEDTAEAKTYTMILMRNGNKDKVTRLVSNLNQLPTDMNFIVLARNVSEEMNSFVQKIMPMIEKFQ